MTASLETHTIHDEAEVAQSIDVVSRFTPDPTAVAPRFALSAKGDNTPGSFVAGAWTSAWSSTTGEITATTPTIGNGGNLEPLVSGNEYWLWQKVTVGSETFLFVVAIISCP